ncbi:glycosyltransferase family 2 protein [Rubrivirga sp. IMCC43871]|uniref:glycosyltransferase family 2 protein n=1 Tax=Rubrivirga sp. IMCC43871 TaxID=3391575 RepID=UPI0039901EA2
MSRPTVSVLVPVHNGGDAFRRCAAALAASLGEGDEWIVVADGETDGAWRDLPPSRASVQAVLQPRARGPAIARNRGADLASGDILFFVDADVVVRPDTVERVRQRFEADPEMSALVGSYDATPGDPAFLSQYRNLLHHYTHQSAGDTLSTFWTGCGAVRREVFEALGGFDESYPVPCIEDIELGYRLTDAGHRIQLDPDLQVTHLKVWEAADMIRTDVFRRAAPWAELLLQRGGIDDSLNVDRRSRRSVAAVGAMLAAGVVAPFRPRAALPVAAVAVCAFLGLNHRFYRTLSRVRSPGFALRAVPWHALYYGCSGAGLVLALVRSVRGDSAARSLAPPSRV